MVKGRSRARISPFPGLPEREGLAPPPDSWRRQSALSHHFLFKHCLLLDIDVREIGGPLKMEKERLVWRMDKK